MRRALMAASVSMLMILVMVATFAPKLESRTAGQDDEKAIWELERSYWKYAQENDLTSYLKLWHKDFLGWPSTSGVPRGKEHITDWLTTHTSKGESLKLVSFQEAAIQKNGDLIVACYWATMKWVDKDGNGTPSTLRILHTWRKSADGWQIVSGMSMPGEPPQK